MLAKLNLEYKGRSKVPESGHRGRTIIQPHGKRGHVVLRSMPEHYNDADSPAQQPCRNRQKWVMHMWKILKHDIKGCFEGPKSDYIQFLSYNLLNKDGRCMVSHGSLTSDDDWLPGDICRKIATPDGQTAEVHLRPTDNGYLCSTEYLSEKTNLHYSCSN